MPQYHNMYFTFIRKTNNPRMDDRLVITKLGENNIRISYTERSHDGCLMDTAIFGYHKLLHYLARVLWLVTVDTDPFVSVQVMIPSYPTSLIAADKLVPAIPIIMDMVMGVCWQWPTVSNNEVTPLRIVNDTTPIEAPQ